MLVDSHCHLNYKGLVEQQGEVLARARSNGVSAMLNISTREREWDEVIGLAEQEEDVWASVGIHPHEADEHVGIDAAKLIGKARHPRVIGIGESGLDYYYDHSDRAQQRASFREHIAAAREAGLPIIVHTRDAEEDTAQILSEEMAAGEYKGVIHCFTASADFAKIALDLGFYISLSGIVTFKNATDLQDIAKWLPADRMLVETDAPFLAPVPHRGKTGEPGFVADTARFVAQLRGEGEDALAAQTSGNFYRLFFEGKAMNIEQDGPSLIWGVVMVMLLVASLAARRLPMGQVARMALAWVAIFAALFAIFSFRFEFQAIWERVKADIAGTGGQTVSGEAIELRRQDDGHYWLQVEVNGNPVRFLVDSGATTTAINAETAADVGVDVDSGGYPVIISTANGRVAAKRGVVRSMKIEQHEIQDHTVVVAENFGDTNVLGMNFLDSMKSWKVEGNVMTLQP